MRNKVIGLALQNTTKVIIMDCWMAIDDDDDVVEVPRIDLSLVERSRGQIQSKTDIRPNWVCILNSFY